MELHGTSAAQFRGKMFFPMEVSLESWHMKKIWRTTHKIHRCSIEHEDTRILHDL